jgi:hypothetical protein
VTSCGRRVTRSAERSLFGVTTNVGKAAGDEDATPDAVAPKSAPRASARPATLAPNAQQPPASSRAPAARAPNYVTGTPTATAPTILLLEPVRNLVRTSHPLVGEMATPAIAASHGSL